MHKLATFANNGDRNTEFGLFNGGGNDKQNAVGLVEISEIFATQDVFLVGDHQMTECN